MSLAVFRSGVLLLSVYRLFSSGHCLGKRYSCAHLHNAEVDQGLVNVPEAPARESGSSRYVTA